MGTYLIHESNIEKLEKKIQSIFNKCKKYGIEFEYSRLGEEFRTVYFDGDESRVEKFIKVQVEGTAKIAGWSFVASLERLNDSNIIRKFDTSKEVPERYWNALPTCEHCHGNHHQKKAYIVYNEETQEFKSVGSSCLKSYTGGLSAEMIASYISCFDTFIEVSSEPIQKSCSVPYYFVEDILPYFAAVTLEYGFHPTSWERDSTKVVGYDFYKANEVVSPSAIQLSMESLVWVLGQDDESEYIHNLKTIAFAKYCRYKDFGLLASLPNAYLRWKHEKKREEAQAKTVSSSNYVGNIGDRLEINTKDFVNVSCWNTQFGTTYLFKFHDEDGNEFIWYASRDFANLERVNKVIGKVKSQQEYNGVKETVLTRCKIEYAEPKEEVETIDSTASEIAFDDWYNNLLESL